eukprot:gene11026-12190_t
MADAKTAGIIIIGDEILKGHTRDTNSGFLLTNLWTLGVKVEKLVVIPDNVDMIAEEIRKFSSKYSIVISSGGIGPTHDDVTMLGIAKAFDEELEESKTLKDVLEKLCVANGISINESISKMAMLPKSACLRHSTQDEDDTTASYPLITVRNVHIFPGVPEYFERSFLAFSDLFLSPGTNIYLYKLYISVDEPDIAEVLTRTDERFKEKVHLGSYPIISESNLKVKVTLESSCLNSMEDAYELLLKELPAGSVAHVKKYSPNSRHTYKEIYKPAGRKMRNISCTEVSADKIEETQQLLRSSNHSHLSSAVKSSWAVFNETFNQYDLDEICIGFNGGKDCTVILHLWLIALKVKYPRFQEKPTALYIKNSAPFPEAEDFIKETVKSCNLDLVIIQSGMKEALEELQTLRPGLKACLMGTRRHDPYSSKLRSFSPTDSTWPRFMRICPILDWSYEDVWDYMKILNLPYCSLYDRGFTSLGSQDNTQPNPNLLQQDGTYLPAFCLDDETEERAGRS